MLLRRFHPDQLVRAARDAVQPGPLDIARRILEDAEQRGDEAIIEHAGRLGDLDGVDRLIYSRRDLARARAALASGPLSVLERAAGRISAFADAQRRALADVDVPVAGGRAGHRFIPVMTAGCYAPGGRYPLPSSVLMTVLTARSAGVQTVWAASPRPTPVTLAAASLAGADALVPLGGAQAIAAMLLGFRDLPPCDAIAGPGNAYVTAAKHLVASRARIDMLAGPSEILIIADESAVPTRVAADLLAQAEHDADAVPQLVTTHAPLIEAVEHELARQLADLPTATTARESLRNSAACVARDLDEAREISDRLAPEHLQLMTRENEQLAARLRNYGALFIGAKSAEVMGDYGAGPNHTLPTGGTARTASGLSVLTFLNCRTWLRLDDTSLVADTAAFARLEGLEAHARAAECRASS